MKDKSSAASVVTWRWEPAGRGGAEPGPGSGELEPAAVAAAGGSERGYRRRLSGLMDAQRASTHPAGEVRLASLQSEA